MSRRLPAVVRILLRLFPEDFRRLHEKGLTRDYPGPSDAGRMTRTLYWLRASADLVSALMGVWWDRLTTPATGSGTQKASVVAAVLTDARFAFRGLRRTPGFTLMAVLTLGLGLGSNAAIFSVVNGVLLSPPPYDEPEGLVRVWSGFLPETGINFPLFPVDPAEYYDFKDQSQSFESLAAYYPLSFTLSADDRDAEVRSGVEVTWDLFELLGGEAQLGRTLLPEDDVEGGPDVVVLSSGMWRSRFAADPEVIGSTIVLNRRSYEVVGVLEDGFGFPEQSVDLYVPARLAVEYPGRMNHFLRVVGRLADGVSYEAATEEVERLMASWEEEMPDFHTGHFLFFEGFQEAVVAEVRPALLALLGAVGFVLLVVCANVANLLVVRGQSRAAEAALRRALGAGRWRIVQFGLIESAILATFGAALGLLFARYGLRAVLALDDGALPPDTEIALDLKVLGFTVLIAVATALVCGIAPVLQSLREGTASQLRSAGRGGSDTRRTTRGRGFLIAAEVALSFVLLVGAGLMTRSFASLVGDDPGFDTRKALVADFRLPAAAYPEVEDALAFTTEVLRAVEALPGVASAAYDSHIPMGGRQWYNHFEVEGVPLPGPGEAAWNARYSAVGANYFETMGIEVVAGRAFDPSLDRADGVPVAIVNSALADQFLGGAEAVGKRIRGEGSRDDQPWWTIVGVTQAVQHERLGGERGPAYYVLADQIPIYNSFAGIEGSGTLVVRSELSDPLDHAAALRRIVADVDDDLALTRVTALESLVGESVARSRFTMALMGLFSGLALVLGGVGIYGVTSFVVSQRRREIGIRKAIGAEDGSIAKLVIRTALVPVAFGMVAGTMGAVGVSGLLTGLLYEVDPLDWPTYTAVFCVLGVAALVALWYPARRAARLDPVVSMRGE